MKLFRHILALGVLLAWLPAAAQGPQDEKARAKQLQEKIDEEVERYTESLKLQPWQTFYVDSILNHDYKAMQEEINRLSSARVSNSDLYQVVIDKWNERIYAAFKRLFNEEQWAKYLKTGGAKDKKARDKREAKRNGK